MDKLDMMTQKISRALAKEKTVLDGEYYCLHHPNALVKKYKKICDCRKPKPGLIFDAAEDHELNLKDCYFVGDALSDVKAGRAAGCKTVLIGQMTDLLNRVIKQQHAEPDYMVRNFNDVPDLIRTSGQ